MIQFLSHLFVLLAFYSILSLSLNLLVGYTGLLSIAQASFAALGGYAFAFCMTRLGLHWLPAIGVGILVPAVLSYVVSVPARRLRSDYFVLASLGFQVIVVTVAENLTSVTGGPYGLKGIPKPTLFGHRFFLPSDFAILSFVIAGLVTAVCIYISHSPYGRALKTIRENERAAIALGKNVGALKSSVFAISAAMAGLGGALYASYLSYLDPWAFDLWQSIFFLNMVLIGGIGNVRGPLLGALVVLVVPELLKLVAIPDLAAANMRQILFGMLVLVVMLLRPRGIAGEYGYA